MKKIIAILLALFSLTVFASCQNQNEETEAKREDQFIVGLECNYAPFNWTEDDPNPYNVKIANFPGKYADGYDIQIAKAIAASLGKVLVIEKLEWDALIPSLEAGRIDAIIAGMSPTEERKQSVLFSDAYYRSSHVVLVMADGKYRNASSVNDFSEAMIICQQGTIYDDLASQLIGAVHGTPLKSFPDILSSMLGFRADATILELPVALGIIAQNSEFSYVTLDPGFVVSEEDVTVSVAVRLNETDLIENINTILAGIVSETRIRLMEQAVNRGNE